MWSAGSCVAGVECFDVIASGSLAIGGSAEGFEAGVRDPHLVRIEEGGGVIFDPRQQAAVEDVAGHRGFEFGSADEKDEGMKTVPREA